MPIDKILEKIPAAHEGLGSTHEHWLTAALAICTTDTFPKLMSRTFSLPSSPGIEYKIAGMTKGAGMIHPNMATLLGLVATDAPIAPNALKYVLKQAIGRSFNSISIDGDTSTNDTVAILANGAAGGKGVTDVGDQDFRDFRNILTEFLTDLAKLVVRDGEGATKFVTIEVNHARSRKLAHEVASTIARSPLVKTALYGKDANWGRILCAAGYAAISNQNIRTYSKEPPFSPEKVDVSFVPADGTAKLDLLVKGEPQPFDEMRAADILAHEDINIVVSLGHETNARATYWTCDYRLVHTRLGSGPSRSYI